MRPDEDIPEDDIIIDDPYFPPTTCQNPEHTNLCMDLEYMCNHPVDLCEAAICSSEESLSNMDICHYLAKESFSNCSMEGFYWEMIDIMGCHDLCDANQMFGMAPAHIQGTCFDPMVVMMEGEDGYTEMEFGCFCEPGFLMGGGRCVRAEDCGCQHPDDGTYMEPRERRVSYDCSVTYTCYGPHSWGAVPHGCGANAECDMTEDGPQCVCKKDFYGNPGYSGECSPGHLMENGSQICYEVADPMFYGMKESLTLVRHCKEA